MAAEMVDSSCGNSNSDYRLCNLLDPDVNPLTQQIVHDYPPLYDEISAAFDLYPSDSIIFSWGDRLYNPYEFDILPKLIAHERVHGERQGSGNDIVDWWKQYIEDRAFRLEEEIPAHRAEYQYILKHGNRSERRGALKITSSRLTAPLYGRLITQSDAMAVLQTH